LREDNMTPYDWLLVRRTVALGLLIALVALAVMVATDETSNTLGGRLGRFAVIAPVVGASATFLSGQQVRARGEARALEAVGATPLRATLGLLLGGVAIGALGPILAMLPSVDIGTLFPTAGPLAHHWSMHDGGWHDASRALVVEPNGSLGWAGAPGTGWIAARPLPRAATALSLALAAVGCPLWTTARSGGIRRGVIAAAVIGSGITAFHLVAAGRLAPFALAVPPIALVIEAMALLRSPTWS
jgi:hypothetical protein